MDDMVNDLVRIAERCEGAAQPLREGPITELMTRLTTATANVAESSSKSWVGYQASVYLDGFRPARSGEFFDSECGLQAFSNRTRGAWREYDWRQVRAEILRRASASESDLEDINLAADKAIAVFGECKTEVLATLDAILSRRDDPAIRAARGKIEQLESHKDASELCKAMVPKGQFLVSDQRAIQGRVQAPPHISFEAWVMEQFTAGSQAIALAIEARYLAKYMEKSAKIRDISVARVDGPIFIGHGRSAVWKDLKDFIQARLKREYEEFNRESTAGISTKDRLLEMLDKCPFAFLVMTAEDEQPDGTWHARANVIHEAGLFQGRYGFKRAIILLEEGCAEFSNVQGIGQIRFPKGNIEAKFEEIRRVLEREGII